MILDKLTEFADATAIALNIGNALAPNTNVIDLGGVSNFPATGEPLFLVLNVDTTFVGVGATIKFELCSDSTADLATSKTIHLDTGAIALATWVAGYRLVYALPQGTYERYLGLWMTVGVANVTAGKLNAFIVKDVAKWRAFADAL